MIPWNRLPGHAQWSGALEALCRHPAPLWVFGELGTGVSAMAGWIASRRGGACLDEAERLAPAELEAWIDAHPNGVLAAHASPAPLGPAAARCLLFRLPSLQEDPAAIPECLAAMAAEEGLATVPAALAALPCPGNLRGLRNRLVRWKLLGQLPEAPAPGPGLPLDSEDLATNLHVLERLLLHRALRRSYGNRVEAAQRLGVSRRQLYLLIARHGDPVRGEPPSSVGPKRLCKKGGPPQFPGSPLPTDNMAR